ncbi:RHS repeat domain-containing protein [Winogradskyella sp.]|uniref:RHS repeat domain-containing protein n=1 Tax=Winogradskyella sp. TaxID=1883156 RepID=UPI003BA9AF2A
MGNIRLTYADSDQNGDIDASSEIIEKNNYYPFGLKHKGYNDVVSANVNSVASRLKTYQGQELNDELGLNWISFRYRNYDAAIGRFLTIDPLAEDFTYNSTYAFQENKLGMGTELEGAELIEH